MRVVPYLLVVSMVVSLGLFFTPGTEAQDDGTTPPMAIIGNAFVGGVPVPEGTEIQAKVEDEDIAATKTQNADGFYVLLLPEFSGSATFTVADVPTAESVYSWTMGEIVRDFDLDAHYRYSGWVTELDPMLCGLYEEGMGSP